MTLTPRMDYSTVSTRVGPFIVFWVIVIAGYALICFIVWNLFNTCVGCFNAATENQRRAHALK